METFKVLVTLVFAAFIAIPAVAAPAPRAVFFRGGDQDGFVGTNLSRWAAYNRGRIRFDSGLEVEFAGANPKAWIEGQGAPRADRCD